MFRRQLQRGSGGIAKVFSSPLQTIREDFGTVRVDHTFSEKDSLAAVYTIDDGDDFTATPVNPFSSDILTLREQVLSLEETHVFSPTLLNIARIRIFARRIFLHRRTDPRDIRPRAFPDSLPDFRWARWWWAEARRRIRKRRSAWRAATTAAICTSRAIFSPTKIASR